MEALKIVHNGLGAWGRSASRILRANSKGSIDVKGKNYTTIYITVSIFAHNLQMNMAQQNT